MVEEPQQSSSERSLEARYRTLLVRVDVTETLDGRMTEAYCRATWEDGDVTETAEVTWWNPKASVVGRFVDPLVLGWLTGDAAEARAWCSLKGATVIRR